MLSSMFDPELVESIRPISRKEYERMVEVGILDEDDRVELLRGVIVTMSPQGVKHAATIEWLTNRLVRSIDPSLSVRPALPFAASDWSEPEPDFAIVPAERSMLAHPEAALLLIEVSDSSLRKDRKPKLEIYAEAGVPEYWIVNLQEMTIEVYTDPTGSGYATKQIMRDGDVVRPRLVPGIELAVADLPR
jgi:Uma2 family endonuclease